MASRAHRGGTAEVYYPTLDGWRALSFLFVFVDHAEFVLPAPLPAAHLLHRGQLGVEIFFVISGFLITSILVRELNQTGTLSLRAFYVRRAFRLLPPQLCYLAVVSLFMILGRMPGTWREVGSALLFFRNYLPMAGPTGHFWSLSVEEHFYFLWPALLLWARSPRGRLGLVLSAVAAVTAWKLWMAPTASALWPTLWARDDLRMAPLLWGALLAVASSEERGRAWLARLPSAVLLGVVAVAVYQEKAVFFPLRPMLVPVGIAAVLSWTMRSPSNLVSRALEWEPMRWVGRRSYGLYVWQQILLPPRFGLSWIPLSPQGTVLLAVCLLPILAQLSYVFLERPLLRVGHGLSDRIRDARPWRAPPPEAKRALSA